MRGWRVWSCFPKGHVWNWGNTIHVLGGNSYCGQIREVSEAASIVTAKLFKVSVKGRAEKGAPGTKTILKAAPGQALWPPR